MQIKDVLQKTTQFFRDKGFSSPRLDTELLLAKALQWDRMKLYLNYDYPMSDAELTAARELVRRRASGEPVAYILGEKDFYNRSFIVSPGVLIPRPETETIVHDVAAWLNTQEGEDTLRVIDMGTGSGCIGLSLLAEVPRARLLAVDLSSVAVQVAGQNAARLGVEDRLVIHETSVDLLTKEKVEQELGGLADAIVANPPYIAENDPEVEANVKKFEPAEALFSADDGYAHIRSWAAKACELVRPGGMIMFEIGYQQAQRSVALFEATGCFDSIEVVKDLAGHDRFVRCFREESTNG